MTILGTLNIYALETPIVTVDAQNKTLSYSGPFNPLTLKTLSQALISKKLKTHKKISLNKEQNKIYKKMSFEIQQSNLFNKTSQQTINRLLKAIIYLDINILELSGPGGENQWGYFLKTVVQNLNLETQIPAHQICASACTLAFISAHQRYIHASSQMMFHLGVIIDNNSSYGTLDYTLCKPFDHANCSLSPAYKKLIAWTENSLLRLPKEVLIDVRNNKDRFVNANEAHNLGIAQLYQ